MQICCVTILTHLEICLYYFYMECFFFYTGCLMTPGTMFSVPRVPSGRPSFPLLADGKIVRLYLTRGPVLLVHVQDEIGPSSI